MPENCTPVCSGPEKHFATILSVIQPSCMCCIFKTYHWPNKSPPWFEYSSITIAWELHNLFVQDLKNTLPPFCQLYSLLRVIQPSCLCCVFKTYHEPNNAPLWLEYSSISIGWEVHPLSVQDLKNTLPPFCQLYSLLRVMPNKSPPWFEYSSITIGWELHNLFVQDLKNTLPLCQLYSLLRVIQPSCLCCVFKTYHGPNKAPLWLKHSSISIGWEVHPLSVQDLKNTLPPFCLLYSLLRVIQPSCLCCVFKTYHGSNKAPLWLEHFSISIG